MPIRILLCLALLSAAGVHAASSGFLLGIDYSEWILNNEVATQIATDSSGALYILSPSSVTKLSADGKTILWQNALGFTANKMAVDPNGGVYVLPVSQPGDTSIHVAKLNAIGTGLAWKTTVGLATPNVGWRPVLAADSQGRAYLAGVYDPTNNQGEIVRLNATGSSIDFALKIAGWPTSIAVDTSGAAFVAGNNYIMGFLARPGNLWVTGRVSVLGLSEEAVELATGGVEGALHVFPAVVDQRAAVLMDHVADKFFR